MICILLPPPVKNVKPPPTKIEKKIKIKDCNNHGRHP